MWRNREGRGRRRGGKKLERWREADGRWGGADARQSPTHEEEGKRSERVVI